MTSRRPPLGRLPSSTYPPAPDAPPAPTVPDTLTPFPIPGQSAGKEQ